MKEKIDKKVCGKENGKNQSFQKEIENLVKKKKKQNIKREMERKKMLRKKQRRKKTLKENK